MDPHKFGTRVMALVSSVNPIHYFIVLGVNLKHAAILFIKSKIYSHLFWHSSSQVCDTCCGTFLCQMWIYSILLSFIEDFTITSMVHLMYKSHGGCQFITFCIFFKTPQSYYTLILTWLTISPWHMLWYFFMSSMNPIHLFIVHWRLYYNFYGPSYIQKSCWLSIYNILQFCSKTPKLLLTYFVMVSHKFVTHACAKCDWTNYY